MQQRMAASAPDAAALTRLIGSAQSLGEHLHEVPVHVIPCLEGRTDQAPIIGRAGQWGAILPAVWSFMLAARARGLGTCLTSFQLAFAREAADVLGIPYERVMQAALIPVAYTLGTGFKPAARKPVASVLHWEHWSARRAAWGGGPVGRDGARPGSRNRRGDALRAGHDRPGHDPRQGGDERAD